MAALGAAALVVGPLAPAYAFPAVPSQGGEPVGVAAEVPMGEPTADPTAEPTPDPPPPRIQPPRRSPRGRWIRWAGGTTWTMGRTHVMKSVTLMGQHTDSTVADTW